MRQVFRSLLLCLCLAIPSGITAQNFRNEVSLATGISVPNRLLFNIYTSNILSAGPRLDVTYQYTYPLNLQWSLRFGSGLTFTQHRKNRFAIEEDCLVGVYTTYVSPIDTLNGRDQRFLQLNAVLALRYAFGNGNWGIEGILSPGIVLFSEVEDFSHLCNPGPSTWIRYEPDERVNFQRVQLGVGAALSRSIQLSEKLVLEPGIVYSINVRPVIRSANAFNQDPYHLRTSGGIFRVGLRF